MTLSPFVVALALTSLGCSRTPKRPPPAPEPAPLATASQPVAAGDTVDRTTARADATSDTGALDATLTRPEPRTRSVAFGDGRSTMVVFPRATASPARLLVMLHGVCTPPAYVCGEWKGVAADVGLLICPVGNTTCGSEGTGPPTWEEPFATIDDDVELAIKATASHAPAFTREGSVLAGHSRGAYAAVILAIRHPGRWPLLILNEADVDLTPTMARGAGLRAVALIAGEWGNQLAGEQKTADALAREGFPARLWTMPKTGHFYSADIATIMKEALEFVLSHEHDG